MVDDGGVLGNLPRSRPGQRSEKRTAAKEASGSSAKAAPGGSPRRAPTRAASGRRSAGDSASRGRDAQPAPGTGDPVGDAIRTVTGVAATGARVAGGVAREVLRRLPRP